MRDLSSFLDDTGVKLTSYLLAFVSGWCMAVGYYLSAVGFALLCYAAIMVLWRKDDVTPSHSSYDVDDEYLPCTECDGVGKVYLLGAMGATATCPQCRGTGRVYNDDYFIF